ncbi:MAG: hypothetical protein CL583_11765 [Alteromonadaceae bacterium]|nr:hypothetical protein [Alteromonadaceae bacterium]
MSPINFKTNGGRLRSAIAATALIAASGAASAEPVNLVLNYTCPFPLIGNQAVIANISADLPSTIEAGTPTGDVPIDVIATVAANAKTGLGLVGAVSVEGTAESGVEAVLPTQTLPLTVLLDIPFTEIPVNEPGTFDVPAIGVQDSLTFGPEDEGTGEIQVEGLTLNMIARTADGSVAPAPIGEFTSVCTLDAGQNNVLQTFEITVEDVVIDDPQNIVVDPASVAFGNVQAGLTEEATVTVSNDGDLPLGINGVSISGADAAAFSQSSDCSVVNAGESCAVTVTYFPSGEGAQNATLTIESDDPDAQFSDVALSGTSVAVPVAEIVVQDEASFGSVLPGESTTQEIVIGNDGTADLTINGIDISGDAAYTQTNDCTTVAPDASCSVTVTFAPQVEGPLSATLSIASNDANSPSQVSLVGTGKVIDDGGDPVELSYDLEGTTTIAASDSDLALTGQIDADLELATGLYTADLTLDNTTATVQISQLFRKLKATAQVQFEQVGQTTGLLQNNVLTSESTMYIKVPKVTTKLFGFIPVTLGGGADCRTSEPVTINLQTPEGETFSPLEGGIVAGEYDLPPLENCGALTGVLNGFLSGSGNTIQLGLTPIL